MLVNVQFKRQLEPGNILGQLSQCDYVNSFKKLSISERERFEGIIPYVLRKSLHTLKPRKALVSTVIKIVLSQCAIKMVC